MNPRPSQDICKFSILDAGWIRQPATKRSKRKKKVLMTATAAMAAIAATARLHVTGLRNAPKLKGFADVLGDGLLDLLHFLLRIQETARNRVFQERLAMLFKIIYFRIGQLQPRVAFLMKHVPFGDQRVVLPAGGV